MNRIVIMMLMLFTVSAAYAGAMLLGGVELLCHRTANEDVPENTLEEAALLGCNVVEIDLQDRIGTDVKSAVQAMGASNAFVNDKAEWMLVQGGPDVLPEVRKALDSDDAKVRERAIRVVAWQGDSGSLERLRAIQAMKGTDAELAAWAIAKIESLHPQL